MEFSKILETVQAAIDSPGPFAGVKEEDRLACLAACNKLQAKLESPLESFMRIMFGVHSAVGLQLGVEMKLLEKAVAAQGPITIEKLASDASVDPDLVSRVVRLLAAMGLFQEVSKDTYVANPLAAAFAAPSPLEAGVLHVGASFPALASLPDYLAIKGYQDPNDAFDGPWQYSRQTSEHYFEWTSKRPKLQQAFNTVMTISRAGRGEEWFEFYPVEEKLSVQSPDDTLLVDIGGGIGHDLIAFNKHFPKLEGKLILEDQSSVVADAKDLPANAKAVGHNFFEPQPSLIKNARAYYLRTVLHDWPNKQAKIILEHIRAVMAKDSVLLLNENSLPETNVPLYPAQLDFMMMANFSALDRTETQFAKLLDDAGFELKKVWRPKVMLPGSAVLFEAVVKN